MTVLAAVWGTADTRAFEPQLSRADMERALALARWPHTDADRARFHAPYVVAVNSPPVDFFSVERIEVITEYRRLELMAEEHARLNDLFGRGGMRDAEDALRPWRGRLSIVVHLRFDLTRYITGVPPIEVTLDTSGVVRPLDAIRSGIYGSNEQLIGGRVEAVFDAPTVGRSTRSVVMRWKDHDLARVPIDFAGLK